MTDILGQFDDISSRAMFGGYGIYREGVFFALIVEDQLYFKVDDSNRAQYEQAGSQPFTYHQGKKRVAMNYWLVPEEVLNSRTELQHWLDQSVRIAKAGKRAKKR